jgi:hypothetical protein
MMVEGDRVLITTSPYQANALGRTESGIMVTLARDLDGYICSLTPKGYEGCALVELDGRRYLVPFENLAFPPGYVGLDPEGKRAADLYRKA